MSKVNNFLPFARPSISQEEIDEVVDCLRSGWITTGPRVQQFTNDLQAYLGAKHVLPLTSGTAGLHLALAGLHLKPGDEVITTPLTFAATANTIVIAGGKPVFVDVELDTYNIDVNKIKAAITPKTKAIVPVHYAGLPVDMDAIYSIAKTHNLRVIEDGAHAIGAQYKGKRIGSFGDTQVFSFHPNKNMTTGEGGCVATSDDELAKYISIQRFHGIDREAWNRFSKSGEQHYDVVDTGFKYNMLDIQAALGVCQLKRLDSFIERRTALANRYLDIFANWKELKLPRLPSYSIKHALHLFAPLINIEKTGFDRDEFIEKMKALDIGIGFHYDAVHLFSFYRDTFGYQQGDFPNAEYIAERIVSLPMFPDMAYDDQDRVVSAMENIFNGK